MEIYKKLQKARKSIKQTDLKKSGYNDYSKYSYFTPEQVDKLVSDICFELNLFTKFHLIRDEHGLRGELVVIDLDSEEQEVFVMATEMPQITATNATQQLGGAVTYTERYLKMTIFGIVDNSIELDNNKPKQKDELTPKHNKWNDSVKYYSENTDLTSIKKHYSLSFDNEKLLKDAAKKVS